MNIFRFISVLLIISLASILVACGKIEGNYVQLSSPFETDEGVLNVSSDKSTSSENVSSDSTVQASDIVCKNEEIVRVSDYIPDVVIDIKYATSDNFTGGKVYNFDDAYLRYGTVMKLKKAADALKKQGYLILIWDGYRPQSAQFTLFENAPDPTLVSDPNKGKSSHSSGGTVDITLVKLDGSAVEMPSSFDDFSEKADRNYDDVSKTAGNNSKILEKAMTDAGFKGYSKEWWHYSDTDSYGYDDVENVKLLNKSKKTLIADCEEYINLRKSASKDSEVVCKIPANAELKPICWVDGFIGVVYGEYSGYVSASFVK